MPIISAYASTSSIGHANCDESSSSRRCSTSGCDAAGRACGAGEPLVGRLSLKLIAGMPPPSPPPCGDSGRSRSRAVLPSASAASASARATISSTDVRCASASASALETSTAPPPPCRSSRWPMPGSDASRLIPSIAIRSRIRAACSARFASIAALRASFSSSSAFFRRSSSSCFLRRRRSKESERAFCTCSRRRFSSASALRFASSSSRFRSSSARRASSRRRRSSSSRRRRSSSRRRAASRSRRTMIRARAPRTKRCTSVACAPMWSSRLRCSASSTPGRRKTLVLPTA